jgi:hypothetical protein
MAIAEGILSNEDLEGFPRRVGIYYDFFCIGYTAYDGQIEFHHKSLFQPPSWVSSIYIGLFVVFAFV